MKALLVLLSVSFLASCTARRGELVDRPVQVDTEKEKRGEKIFAVNCYRCHPGGDAGLAPAINNKPLPDFAMRTQIRNGIGAMPGYTEKEISNDEMDALIEYLKTLRTGK